MKKDMNDLKKIVQEIMSNQPADVQSAFVNQHDNLFANSSPGVELITDKLNRESTQISSNVDDIDDFQDADEYHVLESTSKPTSLAHMEKQMIKDSLEKFAGKRKLAAIELDISERTLYRKIREYGIEY
jgi:DNA-binding NtrC family response regulator